MHMKKCNIAPGPWDFGKDWDHIHEDIYLTGYKRESIDLIYSSHLIEYFDRTEAIDLLTCWYKKLKYGGRLQVSVPDWDKLATRDLDKILGPLYGKMRMGDEWIYHKTVYNQWGLTRLLRNCGFEEIKVWDPDHSFDDCSKAPISLNMEAIK